MSICNKMKEFPSNLSVNFKDKFPEYNRNRMKCYLRRDLYEHVISHKESEYFSIDSFNERVGNLEESKEMLQEIILELKVLGWNCKTSFGGTGIFIYSSENPPDNCYEDD